MIVIYGVVDTSTNELQYVGKTKHTLSVRSLQHFNSRRNTPFLLWIKSLDKLKLIDNFFIIEEVKDKDWQEAERFWISYFKFIGCKLLNKTRGGNGFANHTAETKAKISTTSKGKTHSNESKEKISVSVTAQWAAPGSKIRKAKEGIPRTIEERELMSLKQKEVWQDPEYIARRAELEKTEAMRIKRTKATNARWARPGAKDQNRRPEVVEKISATMTSLWEDEEFRTNRINKFQEAWHNNPKIWITNGIIHKYQSEAAPIPDGWWRGMVKGKSVDNKRYRRNTN